MNGNDARAAAESQIVEPDDFGRQDVPSMPVSEAPRSEPVKLDDDVTEYSASLSEVMLPPGGVVQSDTLAVDQHVDLEMEKVGNRYEVVVPEDSAPKVIDGDIDESALLTPQAMPADDGGQHDDMRREAGENIAAARESKLRRELSDAKWKLNLAKAARDAERLSRRLGA